jgi:hypothetical protein
MIWQQLWNVILPSAIQRMEFRLWPANQATTPSIPMTEEYWAAFWENGQIQFVANSLDPATGFCGVYHGFIDDLDGDYSVIGIHHWRRYPGHWLSKYCLYRPHTR